ncbi:hypothetical protein BASA61_010477 [Batrachochytrium salamandrivorans]|nr:hypothetical protein BASA61_010477 [Batrachochytrium salamandrivorans]
MTECIVVTQCDDWFPFLNVSNSCLDLTCSSNFIHNFGDNIIQVIPVTPLYWHSYKPLAASIRFSPLSRSFLASPLAFCKTASAIRFQSTTAAQSVATAPVPEHKSKSVGSYHWTFERSLSVVSLPLFGSAVVFGSVPAVDFLLGFVVPMHCYFGFESMIEDYLPKRRTGVLNGVCTWSLRLATALVMYGCYIINTRDVGLTALTARLWTGKE